MASKVEQKTLTRWSSENILQRRRKTGNRNLVNLVGEKARGIALRGRPRLEVTGSIQGCREMWKGQGVGDANGKGFHAAGR